MTCEGLVVVNDELFVIRERKSEVNAYDSHSLTSSRDINIPDMKWPSSIAGCAHNQALYIIDYGLKCIHRVDITNNSVTRWKWREGYEPRGLSVTAGHNLLITVWISDARHQSGIVEYTSGGEQVREIEIKFDRSIECAWQTVQLGNNQFIVCHGSGSSLHRVCQINAEGQIIRSYGREEGRAEDQMSRPYSLTTDNNSNHVFVVDMDNHRILLFDSNLTYLGQVHTQRHLSYSRCLYFDSATDRLFVGGLSSVIVISATVYN